MRLKYYCPLTWNLLPRIAIGLYLLYEFPCVHWRGDRFDISVTAGAVLLIFFCAWHDVRLNTQRAKEYRSERSRAEWRARDRAVKQYIRRDSRGS